MGGYHGNALPNATEQQLTPEHQENCNKNSVDLRLGKNHNAAAE